MIKKNEYNFLDQEDSKATYAQKIKKDDRSRLCVYCVDATWLAGRAG